MTDHQILTARGLLVGEARFWYEVVLDDGRKMMAFRSQRLHDQSIEVYVGDRVEVEYVSLDQNKCRIIRTSSEGEII